MNPNHQVLRYLCSSCNNLIIETYKVIDWTEIISSEECPKCGSLLSSQTITTSTAQQTMVQKPLLRPKFQTASRLCFDIEKIDSVLNLGIGDRVCIVGNHSKTLVERLIVSSLLPGSHGGFGSENVIIIDAGNCSDVYRCVNLARQYGLDIKNILRRIVVSRPFTIYQLAELAVNELPKVMKKFDTKTIIVSDILHLFLNDPQVKFVEAENILKPVMKSISQFSRSLNTIVVSFHNDVPSGYTRFLFSNFNKFIQTTTGNSDRTMVKVNSRKEGCKIIHLRQKELQLIQQR
jgi:Rad51 protein